MCSDGAGNQPRTNDENETHIMSGDGNQERVRVRSFGGDQADDQALTGARDMLNVGAMPDAEHDAPE